MDVRGTGYDAVGAGGGPERPLEYAGGQWIWISGSNAVGARTNFGIQGVAAPSNFPGARSEASSWLDASGNFLVVWRICGRRKWNGCHSQRFMGFSAGNWTWISGSTTAAAAGGVCGVQGVAAPYTVPGARSGQCRGPIFRATYGWGRVGF